MLGEPNTDGKMFDIAPVSLWEEDYSALKSLFDEWRAAGVSDLGAYLREDLSRVKICSSRLRVLKVNQKTLSLLEAASLEELEANLGRVFRDDMLHAHVDELVQLWNGHTQFTSHTVNYTLSGKRLDIQLKGTIVPGYEANWERVLVAIEDVTERETARRSLATSEEYARGLFHHSPVSLWVEDFSSVKRLIDEIRQKGILDFRVFTDVHPEFVTRCMSEIRVIDVNRHTLQLFSAPDLPTLLLNLGDVFRDGMNRPFREQLIDLWDGKLFQQREVLNYTLDGRELHLHLQFSVLPGHEHDWSLVQVALTDITARKAAEAYLEFLGKHDVLTKLYNRSFFVDELNRLRRNGPAPLSVIVIDLNGLKAANDQWGHAAGDELLRRAGEVLGKLTTVPAHAARIGGDEFAILLPGADEIGAEKTIEDVRRLVELNNQFYSSTSLSLSIGAATGAPGEPLEEVVKRADARMYEEKHRHYGLTPLERRREVALQEAGQ
ncbi:sensor domain-containing diguanylate cyclase [Kaistia terrae]|uniref:diguanylate cyclase n=1 Tax=Kaistia terrae TaxID=537017 RepID=A0ABW0Q3H5_9HYPH|nr:sensor domain-containing diguanylate cyclase [Kaistia terrae]MCX5579808.1 sensor domain-containing diguanylate cyclase [Kaistia terrae]